MKKLFLHIGAHKTGTTAIQMAFDINSILLKKHGVIFPRSNWYHHSQHRIAFAMHGYVDQKSRKAFDLGAEVEELNTAIDRTPDDSSIFVSSEELFSAPIDSIQQLKTLLKYDNIEIIAFTRRPDEFILSSYNQKVKTPENEFFRPLNFFIKNPSLLDPDLDMKGCVENWEKVFGQKNIQLCRYEDEPPLQAVLNLIGLPKDIITSPDHVNKSTSASAAEVIRLSKAAKLPPHRRRELFDIAVQVFSRDAKQAIAVSDRHKILLDYKDKLDVLFAKYGMENTYLPENVVEDSPEANLKPVHLLFQIIESLLIDIETERTRCRK